MNRSPRFINSSRVCRYGAGFIFSSSEFMTDRPDVIGTSNGIHIRWGGEECLAMKGSKSFTISSSSKKKVEDVSNRRLV